MSIKLLGNPFAVNLVPSCQGVPGGKLVLTCSFGQVRIPNYPGKGAKHGPLS